MQEEEPKKEQQAKMDGKEGEQGTQYVDILNKANEQIKSLSAQLEQSRADNKKFAEQLLNGQEADKEEPIVADLEKIKSLRKELYGGECNLNNLQYWTKTLELRNELIKNGERDPMLPYGKTKEGKDITPTPADIEHVEKLTTTIESLIKEADGNSEYFTNELQRITQDVSYY